MDAFRKGIFAQRIRKIRLFPDRRRKLQFRAPLECPAFVLIIRRLSYTRRKDALITITWAQGATAASEACACLMKVFKSVRSRSRSAIAFPSPMPVNILSSLLADSINLRSSESRNPFIARSNAIAQSGVRAFSAASSSVFSYSTGLSTHSKACPKLSSELGLLSWIVYNPNCAG